MIFIDSNLPMYLVGADHPNKGRALQVTERLVAAGERLVTSAEVFQEILHRYTAINRRQAIRPTWDVLAGIVDEVFPVDLEDVEKARDLVIDQPELSARDAVHASVMKGHRVSRIVSFDGGFDSISGIIRID